MGILSFLFDACISQLLKRVSQKIFLLCWVEGNCEIIFWQFCFSHVQCVAFRFTSITPTAAKFFRLRTIDECFNVKNRWRNTAVDCWFFWDGSTFKKSFTKNFSSERNCEIIFWQWRNTLFPFRFTSISFKSRKPLDNHPPSVYLS